MKSKKTIELIIAAILIGFAATGSRITLSSASELSKVAEQASAEAAGPNSEENVAVVPAPVSTSREAVRPIVMDSMLIGTAIVEGGTSFAVLQSADGTRLVREGDEIAGGVQLVQVWRNRIEIESKGGRQEIRIGMIDAASQLQIPPGPDSIRGPENQTAVDRMSELRRQMIKRRVFVSNRWNAAGAGR